MTLITLRQLLDHAAENDYGMPAFNINNMEQLLAIMVAAERTCSPVIVQASRGARSYAGDILAMNVVKAIHEKLPNTHLVMHGSSSVPQELQDLINAYGGEMPQTFGVPVEEIVTGMKHGVRKANIDTDCRMAMTGMFRKVATENKAEFDPRKFLKPAMSALEKLCAERFEQFGTAGNAPEIQPVSLAEMASRYQTGSLTSQRAAA